MVSSKTGNYWSSSCCLAFTVSYRRRLYGAFLVVALLLIGVSATASDRFIPEPSKVFIGADAGPWERVELLTDSHPGFKQENFSKAGEQQNPLIKKWFGDDPTPHGNQVLLHCYRGFNGKTLPRPILLVHGAGDNANRAWIHPASPHLAAGWDTLPEAQRGFAFWLNQLGYAVFAVTFSHNQGDNIMQSEQIANAIQRIRVLTNRASDPSFKIDIVAHSKGNVAARLYCSDSRAIFPQKEFLSHFRHDVGAWIAIASPFRGIDTAFRYYGYNLAVATNPETNGPVSTEKMLVYGFWKDFSDRSIYTDGKNCFPGQCQLLTNLVADGYLPLGIDSFTPDANYTMTCAYFGGLSTILVSRGIDVAIEQGERLIYRLEERGLEPDVALGVIAGSSPFITYKEGKVMPQIWEYFTPAGDGLLPLVSATHTKNAVKRGAKLLGQKVLDLNHLAIGSRKDLIRLIDDFSQSVR